MAVNKVVLGNQTIMDITDTTATADKVVSGYTAYGANGVKMTGTLNLSGFMTKSTYDTDDDGVVDLAENAQNLGGNPPSYYAPASAIPTIDSALDAYSTNPVQNAVITQTLNTAMTAIYQDFVEKTGDTMTGSLTIENVTNENKGLILQNAYNDSPSPDYVYSKIHSTLGFGVDASEPYAHNMLHFKIGDSDGAAEDYSFTPISEKRSSGAVAYYTILTTKEPVSISQGGTGAKTADAACANLGALPLTGGTVTGSITSTRNGIGFYSRGTSEAAGFSTSNATTGRGVSMQINAAGTNRGIYDNSGGKWMMYCDSNDALRFSGVTSATKSDLGIDDLEDSIGTLKTTTKTISSDSSATFTFDGFCGVAILISGANSTQRCILIAHCSSAGNISVTKIGTASNITTSTATNKLTVTNAYATAAVYARVIRITSSGTMPT